MVTAPRSIYIKDVYDNCSVPDDLTGQLYFKVSIQNEAHVDWHLVRRSPNKRACPYVRHSSSE